MTKEGGPPAAALGGWEVRMLGGWEVRSQKLAACDFDGFF